MTRRNLLAATATLAATLALATPALAQGRGEIVMGAWGGGTSATWRTGVGEPFTARTGMPVRINEWPDPEPQLRAQAGGAGLTALQVQHLVREIHRGKLERPLLQGPGGVCHALQVMGVMTCDR